MIYYGRTSGWFRWSVAGPIVQNVSKALRLTHLHRSISSFIPLACAECDNSLPFSGASAIHLCYVLFPATFLHQLFVHSLSPYLAIYFLVYLSILLFPNSYIPNLRNFRPPRILRTLIFKGWFWIYFCSAYFTHHHVVHLPVISLCSYWL